ncbi:MAG: response regulator transcription factor [Bacteroidota bacterium]
MRKFLFIDDHAVVRASFIKILSEPFNPVEVDEASNGAEAIEKVKAKKFDLVIMDIQMPDTDTLGLIEFIKTTSPRTKILMLSMIPENVHAKHYLKAGADGYASKQSPLDEVTKAMDLVLQGRKYVSDTLAEALLEETIKNDNPFNTLSQKEYEIAMLLLQGKSITDMSKMLNVAMTTISTHKSRMFEKLKVANLMELKELSILHNL